MARPDIIVSINASWGSGVLVVDDKGRMFRTTNSILLSQMFNLVEESVGGSVWEDLMVEGSNLSKVLATNSENDDAAKGFI